MNGITGGKCRRAMRQESTNTREGKDTQGDRSASYAVFLYEMETVPMTSSHVKKLEVTEMKMCRWACMRPHTNKRPCEKRCHQGET